MSVLPSGRLAPGLALIASVLICGAYPAAPARAGDLSMKDSIGLQEGIFIDKRWGMRIDGGVAFGSLNGEAHEYVYEPNGHKLSELIWTMDDLAMIGGTFEVSMSPWFKAGVEGWINGSKDGHMDDYDWLNPDDPFEWTHWSSHKETEIQNAHLLDLYASLALYRAPWFDLRAVAGYRHDQFDWNVRGGHFIYSSDPEGTDGVKDLRDVVGDFDHQQTVISYTQTYSTPYLGASAALYMGPLTVEGRVVGSSWASIEGDDQHWLRGLRFRDNFDQGEMVEANIRLRYQVTDQLAVTGSYKYTDYTQEIGQTRIQDPNDVFTYLVEGRASAGISNESQLFSAGLTYTFN
ncbi:MAG: omptin family outer membrane protease [Hyphomicrobiaceae bacterium]